MLTNGGHNTESTPPSTACRTTATTAKAWLDQWVRGVNGGFGSLKQARSSVSVCSRRTRRPRSTRRHRPKEVLVPNGRKGANVHSRTALDGLVPARRRLPVDRGAERGGAVAIVVSGTKRQFWSYQAGGDVGPPLTTAAGPDELAYRSDPVVTDTALAGPITSTLFVQSTAPDTELFVELVDEAPDGSRTYLQRGVLRLSHRAVDDAQSDHTADGRIYRPHRPHTNPTNITPGQTYDYLVEVWPVRHMFPVRAPHLGQGARPAVRRQLLRLRAPQHAGVNTVLQGPDTPSRITLPMVPLTGVQLGPPPPCGAQEAVRCVAAARPTRPTA